MLLQLEKHITSSIVVAEEVNIVDDEDEWATFLLAVSKANLLKLIQSFEPCQRVNATLGDRPWRTSLDV